MLILNVYMRTKQSTGSMEQAVTRNANLQSNEAARLKRSSSSGPKIEEITEETAADLKKGQ